MNEVNRRAVEIADALFRDFMRDVVNGHVVNIRVGKYREREGHIDDRTLHLLSISGKGSPDFPDYDNVTLLDHLLSVCRGAVVLGVLDGVTELTDEEVPFLERQLAVTVATAFLHDLDKDLELPRNVKLTPEMVGRRMEEYGIRSWLEKYQVTLTPAQMLNLIGMAEGTQHFRYLPDAPMPREASWAARYVEIADKLDGIWLHKNGGIDGVLRRLQDKKYQKLRNPLSRQWRLPPVDIFDPHHPFLLDELQRCLSWECSRRFGIPPLIEIHKDGRLLMLLPERGDETDVMIDNSLARFAARLPGGLRLYIELEGKKGVPALSGGQPDYDELCRFLWGETGLGQQIHDTDLVKIFYISPNVRPLVEEHLAEPLDEAGMTLKWSENMRLPFQNLEDFDPQERERFMHAAILALLLNLPDKPDTREIRRKALEVIFRDRLPNWLEEIGHKQTRSTLTAVWATLACEEGDPQFEAIWGETGLLRRWWEGREGQSGLRHGIDDQGAQRVQAALVYFRTLLQMRRVEVEDEDASGRCLFTDQPVPLRQVIRKHDELYGVNINAFSGRDGRIETLDLAEGHTNVGPISILEYQLRQEVHERLGVKTGKKPPVPTLIFAPTTSGLFGGFTLDNEQAIRDLPLHVLTAPRIRDGAVNFNLDHYSERTRVARFVRLAEKTKDQVSQLRDLLFTALRLGRPIHAFRGLPTAQRTFFYYDALPAFVEAVIGGNALRLERLPEAIDRLEVVQVLLETDGLGYDIARAYASPRRRFGALCLAWCHLLEAKKSLKARKLLLDLIRNDLKEHIMNEYDRAFVRFGQAAATIQKGFGEGASNSVQLCVFNLAFDAVANARKYGQTASDSLENAVAGDLEENLPRKELAADAKWRNDKSLYQGCLDVARQFVSEVWFGALKGHPPPQHSRATLASIYRVALLETFRTRKTDEGMKKQGDQSWKS